MKTLSAQEALVYLMVIVSASDRDMGDPELSRIGAVVRMLPAFRGFDANRTLAVAQDCQQWLQRENGLAEILEAAGKAIPEAMHDTAYALAVDVAVADLQVEPEEFRLLQLIRGHLSLERATVSAIERAARARHRSLEAS